MSDKKEKIKTSQLRKWSVTAVGTFLSASSLYAATPSIITDIQSALSSDLSIKKNVKFQEVKVGQEPNEKHIIYHNKYADRDRYFDYYDYSSYYYGYYNYYNAGFYLY
jgi:hypothetical protein